MLTKRWWFIIEGEPVTVNPDDTIAPGAEIVTIGIRPIVDEDTVAATWQVAGVTQSDDTAAGTIADRRVFAHHPRAVGVVLAHTHRCTPVALRSAAPLECQPLETRGDPTVNSHTVTPLSPAARNRPAGLISNMASEAPSIFAVR